VTVCIDEIARTVSVILNKSLLKKKGKSSVNEGQVQQLMNVIDAESKLDEFVSHEEKV
jgi:pimeloyl-CoA synthetase